jgi:hypothetical protein
MGGKWKQKLGDTPESSIVEVDDDLLVVCIQGLWHVVLQHVTRRGVTRECQFVMSGWNPAKICAKPYRGNALQAAYRYQSHASKTSFHASREVFLLPEEIVTALAVLQKQKVSEQLLRKIRA